jgi:hypothetical protein
MAEYTEEELKKLGDTVRNLSKDIQNQAKKQKASAEQEAKIARDKIREARQDIATNVKNKKLRQDLNNALEDQIDNYEDLKKKQSKQLEQLGKLGDSFVGLGKAAFEGSGSISAFTDNIKGLGFLGRRLDTNVETFRQLSQSGANFGQSIVELRTAAAAAALPLDDFASLVANNSSNLAALFGSTTEGAKRIAELGRITREVGIDRLAPLGFTVDELNETLLLNLDSQRRTGILNTLTDDQRRDSAISFAEQLDRLAKLTGQQRDELRAQIEQQKSNERFQAALQRQTDETRQRLQAFAGTVAGISPELATGFQDLIANAGVPVTEAALEVVQNVPQAGAVIKDLISGVTTSEQALVRLRDISAASVDRFNKATVTGQVEFLRLQGGFIELGRRITDNGKVLEEQNRSATSLVRNLTTFEDATKVLSSQFQGIETALLQSFGPALGGLVGTLKASFGAGGAIATALAQMPIVSAGLLIAGLGGKFLFSKAIQIGIIAKGTELGFRMAKTGGGLFQTLTGGKDKGARAGGGIRSALNSNVGRGLGAAGVALTGLSVGNQLLNKDKSDDASGLGGLIGMGLGGIAGFMLGGPGGALLGASLGGSLGQGAGAFFGGERQFGGGMDASKMYLTGEGGPEIVRTGTKSAAVANQDLKSTFNTEALESKMSTMITELNSANKTLTNMVNGVNTLVAIESRSLKAVETTARKDRNQVGLV